MLSSGSVRSILAETERVVELPATSKTSLESTVGVSASTDSSEAVSVKLSSFVGSARPEPLALSEDVKAWDRELLRHTVFSTLLGFTSGAMLSTMNVLEDSLTLLQVALVALAYTTVVPWPSVGAVALKALLAPPFTSEAYMIVAPEVAEAAETFVGTFLYQPLLPSAVFGLALITGAAGAETEAQGSESTVTL